MTVNVNLLFSGSLRETERKCVCDTCKSGFCKIDQKDNNTRCFVKFSLEDDNESRSIYRSCTNQAILACQTLVYVLCRKTFNSCFYVFHTLMIFLFRQPTKRPFVVRCCKENFCNNDEKFPDDIFNLLDSKSTTPDDVVFHTENGKFFIGWGNYCSHTPGSRNF